MKTYKKLYSAFWGIMAIISLSSCEKLDIEEYMYPDGKYTVATDGSVDLGLSVEWAAKNLSSSTEGFALSYTDAPFDFKWWNLNSNYCPLDEIGGTEYDEATRLLGDDWQTPSKKQWQELLTNCTLLAGNIEGINGIIAIGKNGNAIFLPLTKVYYYNILDYWTSTRSDNSTPSEAKGIGVEFPAPTVYKYSPYSEYKFESTGLTYQAQIRPVKVK